LILVNRLHEPTWFTLAIDGTSTIFLT